MKYTIVFMNFFLVPMAEAQFFSQVVDGLAVTKPHVVNIASNLMSKGAKQKWSLEQKKKAAQESNPGKLSPGWQYEKAANLVPCKEFVNAILVDGGLPKIGESKLSPDAKYAGTMNRLHETNDPPALQAARSDKSSAIETITSGENFKIKAHYQQIPFASKMDVATGKRIYKYHQRFIKPGSTNFNSKLFDSVDVNYSFDVAPVTTPKSCKLKTIDVVGKSKNSGPVSFKLSAQDCVKILEKDNEKDKRWVELLSVRSDKSSEQGETILHDKELTTTEESDMLAPFCASAIRYFGELHDGYVNQNPAQESKPKAMKKAVAQ